MATYYVDYEGGNDSNDGLSFATRKKTIDSATTSRLPGDEIRVMGTRSSVVGNATWTSHKNNGGSTGTMAATYTTTEATWTKTNHGYETGDWIRFSGISAVQYNGIFPVTKIDNNTFSTPNNLVYTGTLSGGAYRYKQTNCIVKLDTPVTKNIMYSGWNSNLYMTPVGSTNVTGSRLYYNNQTTYTLPQGAYFADYNITTSFTTGKAAYHTLPSTLDLTGYRQISLFMRQITGSVTSTTSHCSIKLCSDTTGDVPVYSFSVPPLKVLNRWQHVLLDSFQDMSTPINSVAFYVNTDIGAMRVNISSLIACKGPDDPDLLHQGSVISTKRDTDCWYSVNFISEDIISIGSLDANSSLNNYSNSSSNSYGYAYDDDGVTYYGPLYASHPIDMSLARYNYYTNNVSTNYSLVYSNNISITGGWDRTDMSTRNSDDLTWLTVGQTYGRGIVNSGGKSGVTIENFGFTKMFYGLYFTSLQYNHTFNNIHSAGCAAPAWFSSTANGFTLNNWTSAASTSYGFYSGSPVFGMVVNNLSVSSTANGLYQVGQTTAKFNNVNIRGHSNGQYIAGHARYIDMKNVSIRHCNNARYFLGNAPYNPMKNVQIYNCNYINNRASGTDVFYNGNHLINLTASNIITDPLKPALYSERWMGIGKGQDLNIGITVPALDSNMTSYDMDMTSRVTAVSDTTVTRSGGGKSIKLLPQSGFYAHAAYQTRYKFATVAVTGGRTVTFSAWLYRNAPNYNSIRIGCLPQLEGISDIIYSDDLTAINTWTQLSVTVSPSISGVLDFYVFYDFGIYGAQATYNIWIDDIECTQV